jgi:hypothetical protein
MLFAGSKVVPAFERDFLSVKSRLKVVRRICGKAIVLDMKEHYFFMIKQAFQADAFQSWFCLQSWRQPCLKAGEKQHEQ